MRWLLLSLCCALVSGLVYAQEPTDSADTSEIDIAEAPLPDSLLSVYNDTGVFVGFFFSDMAEAAFTKGADTVYYVCGSENIACFLANNAYTEVALQVETWRIFLDWIEENVVIDYVTIVQAGDATSDNTAVPDEPVTPEDSVEVHYCDSIIGTMEIGSW